MWSSSRNAARVQLRVEALEDRTVPSFLAPVSSPGSFDAVGDFNNDGRADLAAIDTTASTVGVRLGNGDGTFQAAPISATSSGPKSLVIGDFNRDGKLDVVTGNTLNLSVLLGKGDGSFQPRRDFNLPKVDGRQQRPGPAAVGDLNNDGKLDLVVNAKVSLGVFKSPIGGRRPIYQDYLNVLLGKGDGSFRATETRIQYGAPLLGDVNGDGKVDVLAGSNLQLGNGNGTLRAPISAPVVPQAVADVNGDDKADLVSVGDPLSSVGVYLSNGDGTFGDGRYFAVGVTPIAVAVEDFNRDGKLDIVTANSGSGTVSVLLGNGDGTFQTAQDFAADASADRLSVGDFNADGWLDLAVGNGSGLWVLLNDRNL